MGILKGVFKYTFLIMNILSYKVYGQEILIDKQNEASVTDSFTFVGFFEREIEECPKFGFYNITEHNYTSQEVESTEKRIDLTAFHIPCKSNNVTSSFGYRKSFRRNHYGTDIKVFVGDTIYSIFSGVVSLVAFDKNGYGKYVRIKHDNGFETLYAHLSKHLVTKNQRVFAGEPIGLGGNTGRSTGSHLHFEIRLNGKHINPEDLFSFEHRKPLMEHVLVDNGKIIKNELTKETIEEKEKSEILHKVKRGETLSMIANKYKMSVDGLKKKNGLTKNTIFVGQVLRCS